MHAKISVFVIGVEAIIHLLLHNLHDRTFNLYPAVNLVGDYLSNKKMGNVFGSPISRIQRVEPKSLNTTVSFGSGVS